jgi:hypothetical protein
LARESAVVEAVANCPDWIGYWSDASIWSTTQIPDNGKPPGVTYEVVVPPSGCFSVYLDVSFTVDQLSMGRQGYWDGAKDKAAKVRADRVSLVVLKDADIDEFVLTNSKLEVGGTASAGYSDGWFLTNSKLKTGSYRQGGLTQSRFEGSSLQVEDTFSVDGYSWAQLDGTSLQTGTLELGGALSLLNSSRVQVKGDYRQGSARSSLGVSLGDSDIEINGDAYLGRYLWAWLSEEGAPAIGREFTLMRCTGTIIGTWTDVDLPELPPDRAWSLIYGPRSVSLRVVPAA